MGVPVFHNQKTLYLAFDIANVVWEDADTQAIITRFAKNLAATQHSLEWANIAGGAAFEIVLTAILAALTAGAGATVALAGKGKYLRKLGELLRDLAEPLKRLKRRWGKGSRGKGAGSGNKAVVEEVDAPGYNEPPEGDMASQQEVAEAQDVDQPQEIVAENSPDQLGLVTNYPNAHSIARHGGSVTDEQLMHRALTGIAPDGHVKVINGETIVPTMSSAFHSDDLLVFADQSVRNNGALNAAIANNPDANVVTVYANDVGDLGADLGRGFKRIGSSRLRPDMQGPPQFVDDLRSVQATYGLNSNTGVWETITIFPAKAP